MPQPLDTTHPVVALLIEHGPLSDDDIVQKLTAAGVADPESVLDEFGSAYDAPTGLSARRPFRVVARVARQQGVHPPHLRR